MPLILLGRPDSLNEHPRGLGIPAPRVEVGAGRIEERGKPQAYWISSSEIRVLREPTLA